MTRRRFLGWVVAAPTLVTAADLLGVGAVAAGPRRAAAAGVPSVAQVAEYYDLLDLLRDSQLATSQLIAVEVSPDGTVGFALHRTEVGQGLTTTIAMLIADEMGVRLEDVKIRLARNRPELLFNQITGGSHSTHSLYTPVRVAAAIARERLLQAAALKVGGEAWRFELVDSIVRGPNGETLGIGELATAAAGALTEQLDVVLREPTERTLIGTRQRRIDARAIVTGAQKYVHDLGPADGVPRDALPTMVARPPTIGGTVAHFANPDQIRAMPGVTDVAVIPSGVAVRAATFGQCIDAIQAMQITWNDGPAAGLDDAAIQEELRTWELPTVLPEVNRLLDQLGLGSLVGGLLGGLAPRIDAHTYTFAFQSNSPLEPNGAIAAVTGGRAEIWAPLKNPNVSAARIAQALGLVPGSVTVHVTQAGGSFGRALFWDAALEAALASKAFGKPVRLMWHRADEFRHGRVHPASRSTIATISHPTAGVLFYAQHHTSVQTDFTHGFGDLITATVADLPPDVRSLLGNLAPDLPGAGDIGFSQTVFALTQYVPYNFGVAEQLINETNTKFRTSSMRNIYSPNVVTARELTIDRLCAVHGHDRYRFRLGTLKDQRSKAVLAKVAEVGQWGRPLPPGVAQGIAFHSEYKSRVACLVEVDARPETVNRAVPHAYTGPRVTRAVVAVDVGLPINPQGLEAQMLGGLSDGIANALTFALHLDDGRFLEASWDQSFYTRQWNTPLDVQVIVMPPTSDVPGGAGELGVAAPMAATACAYAAATGTWPTHFPINHGEVPFTPVPTTPSVPQSPTDGLAIFE